MPVATRPNDNEMRVRMDNIQSDLSPENAFILKNHRDPRHTVWMLMWAGFWTGVVLCGFVLLMR